MIINDVLKYINCIYNAYGYCFALIVTCLYSSSTFLTVSLQNLCKLESACFVNKHSCFYYFDVSNVSMQTMQKHKGIVTGNIK